MILATLSALLSFWRKHPLQLVTLVVGLALATGLWSAVQAINGEARASYDRAAGQLGLQQDKYLKGNPSIPLTQYVALKRAGWNLAPVLQGQWRIGQKTIDLVGIDVLNPPPVAALSDYAAPLSDSPSSDSTPVVLSMITPPGTVLMHPETMEGLQDLPTSTPSKPTYRPSLNIPKGTAIADISVAARLLNAPTHLTRILVLPEQPLGLTPLDELAPTLTLVEPEESNDLSRLTESFHLNLTAFGFLSFSVGLFIVQGTISLAIEQHRPLIRTLRSLGVPISLVSGLVALELLLIGVFSGVVGLGLGFGVAKTLLPGVQATLADLYDAEITETLTFRPLWAAAALAMTLCGTLLAGSRSLWLLWHFPILTSPVIGVVNPAKKQGDFLSLAAGFGVLLSGLLWLTVFGGLLGGFALLAGMMLGAAFVLPPTVDAFLKCGLRYSKSPWAEWLWADTRSLLPGLSLSLMAFLLAISTNIGVGTMVSSFRLTFEGWLDQRLASELYVTLADDAQGQEFEGWVMEQAGMTALPIRWSNDKVAGAPVRVYGFANDPTYRDHWPILSSVTDVWIDVFDHGEALINEQLSYRFNLQPGDTLTLGTGHDLNVAGIYSDYGNPNGQIMVALKKLDQIDNQTPNNRFGLRVVGQEIEPVMETVIERFSLSDQDIIDQSSLKDRSRSVFEETFVITQALNILTLAVAGFAILTSLLTLWNQRLPQLAPIWALGLTRGRLAMFDILRSLLLAGFTALLALPLGLLVAWVLLSIVNVEAFGWRLPMFLFPRDWAHVVLLALLCSAIAAAISSVRLLFLSPSFLLRVFSSER